MAEETVMRQYPKVLRVGSPRRKEDAEETFRLPIDEMDKGDIVIQEKVDGSCFRFAIHPETGSLIFGSKKKEFIEDGEPLSPEELPGMYVKAAKIVRDEIGYEIIRQLEENRIDALENGRSDAVTPGMEEVDHGFLTFFCENMVLHSFDYDWEETPQLIGFDIHCGLSEKFMHPKTSEGYFEDLGIETAPTHRWIKDYEDVSPRELERFKVPESSYRGGEKAEGVVIKNTRKQIYAKIHNEEFSEVNEQTFGHTKKQAETDEERILARYCTNRRIIKVLQKLVIDHGHDLSMELLGDSKAHHKVYRDYWKEELDEIINSSYEVDFYQLRSMTADRVREVLKRRINIMERNDISANEALSARWDRKNVRVGDEE